MKIKSRNYFSVCSRNMERDTVISDTRDIFVETLAPASRSETSASFSARAGKSCQAVLFFFFSLVYEREPAKSLARDQSVARVIIIATRDFNT